MYNANALTKAPNFNAYEVEDAETTKDLADFALANAIYCALAEGYAAEVRSSSLACLRGDIVRLTDATIPLQVSARRNAMDNASKNAGEMSSLPAMVSPFFLTNKVTLLTSACFP